MAGCIAKDRNTAPISTTQLNNSGDYLLSAPYYIPMITVGTKFDDVVKELQAAVIARRADAGRPTKKNDAPYYPPLHRLTVNDAGSVLSAFSISIYPEIPVLLVFRDQTAFKILMPFHPSWRRVGEQDGVPAFEVHPLSGQELVDAIATTPTLSLHQLGEYVTKRLNMIRATEAHAEPPPLAKVFMAGVLGNEETHQSFVRLLEKYDGGSVILGGSPDEIAAQFGPPIEEVRHAGEDILIYGPSADSDIPYLPRIAVHYNAGAAVAVFSDVRLNSD